MRSIRTLFDDAPDAIRRLFVTPQSRWTEADMWQLLSWLFYQEPAAVLRARALDVLGSMMTDDIILDFLYEIAPRRETFIRQGFDSGAHDARTFGAYFAKHFENYLRKRLGMLRQERESVATLASERRSSRHELVPRNSLDSPYVLHLLARCAHTVSHFDAYGLSPEYWTGSWSTKSIWPAPENIVGVESGKRAGDWVECTIFGPRAVAPARRALIQVFVHRPSKAHQARDMAKEFDSGARRLGAKGLGAPLPLGTKLLFAVDAPELRIRYPVQSMVWRGSTDSVSFSVKVPAGAPLGPVVGTITVAAEGIPIGLLNFKLQVEEQCSDILQAISHAARRFTQAFVSYATKDRDKVLQRVQVLQAAQIEFFQDVLSLDPGDRWKKEIYRHIDSCDLFLLFWSAAARKSRWVMKETRYAFDRQKGNPDADPAIRPVLIEEPIPAPPRYLKHLQFNDKLLALMGRGSPFASRRKVATSRAGSLRSAGTRPAGGRS
jgi:hypothetical protein